MKKIETCHSCLGDTIAFPAYVTTVRAAHQPKRNLRPCSPRPAGSRGRNRAGSAHARGPPGDAETGELAKDFIADAITAQGVNRDVRVTD
jgi:hypothetical protein